MKYQKEDLNQKTKKCIIKWLDDYYLIIYKFNYQIKHREGVKILTTKQMLQSLPIGLAQVKADNTSENLLNGIQQIIYSLFRAKQITQKVRNNIVNSIKV